MYLSSLYPSLKIVENFVSGVLILVVHILQNSGKLLQAISSLKYSLLKLFLREFGDNCNWSYQRIQSDVTCDFGGVGGICGSETCAVIILLAILCEIGLRIMWQKSIRITVCSANFRVGILLVS